CNSRLDERRQRRTVGTAGPGRQKMLQAGALIPQPVGSCARSGRSVFTETGQFGRKELPQLLLRLPETVPEHASGERLQASLQINAFHERPMPPGKQAQAQSDERCVQTAD